MMSIQPNQGGASAPEKPKMHVNQGACMGCGYCETVCPTGAITLLDVAYIDSTKCVGCGSCAGRCPIGAIS